MTNFPPGYALVTVFVNGIPSAGNIIQVGFPLASNAVQNFSTQVTTRPICWVIGRSPPLRKPTALSMATPVRLCPMPGSARPLGPALQNLSNNTAVVLDGNGSYVNTSLIGGLSSTGSNADQGSIIGWFELTNLPSTAGRISPSPVNRRRGMTSICRSTPTTRFTSTPTAVPPPRTPMRCQPRLWHLAFCRGHVLLRLLPQYLC